MKIIPIEEIQKRIEERFPNQPFEIIEYTKVTRHPFSIKCKKCGEINTYSCFNNFISKGNSKQFLCPCYNKNNSITKHKENEKKILKLCEENDNIEFVEFGYREYVRKYSVTVLCKKCNQTYNKDWSAFLKNQSCPYCDSRHDLNSLGFKAILPKDYELLSEYSGTENKVLIRHNCGFIWNIKPHTFIQKINSGYKGCPQCNHKRSRGEMNIATWLENNHINFIEEQIFSWSSNSKFRYDFYVPDYNLIIEYHGEPHYKEIAFFHDTLEQRQEHDRIKEKEARENGFNYLIIPYTDFKNIGTILTDWFNDYSERK